MSIKELIEKLNQYPEGASVYIVNKWGNWAKVTEVVPNTILKGPEPTAVCLRGGSHGKDSDELPGDVPV